MRARNYVLYGSEDKLTRLMRDYIYLGREAKVFPDGDGGAKLVVYALPQRKPKKQDDKKRGRGRR